MPVRLPGREAEQAVRYANLKLREEVEAADIMKSH